MVAVEIDRDLAAMLRQRFEENEEFKLIEGDAYYAFSSVFFYTNRQALLWNGRTANLEYGSYAPTAPHVFIGDRDFRELWLSDDRYYLLADHEDLPYLQELVGAPGTSVSFQTVAGQVSSDVESKTTSTQ